MDIAIIGIAGRFARAKNLEELYGLLAAGQDCVRSLSDERKSKTSLPFDKDYIEIAYMDDIDLFDPKYFGIAKAEAAKMAPQQRMALEVVQETLDNSGYAGSHFYNSRTSVYVGDTHINYDQHITPPLDPTEIMGSASAFLAGRIARSFHLRGAAAMIDTTCSSALVALHTAINGLQCGDSDHALVLGVNVEEFPIEKSTRSFGEEMGANILSSSYRAKTFSAAADGTGIGEAVVCVLLKPLEAALRDQDFIHAVIKGSAVNQDAALSASLTAPDPEAQAEVLIAAWKKSRINPEDIDYIEAHGTGTTLGDPIEVDGIKRAFRAFTKKERFCSISSIKTNLGHTDSAAGLAGLAKVVLSLRHKVLFPNVHYDQPNPLIDFDKMPVFVQAQLATWEKNSADRRVAGLSAFGLIGTNCHVVVQEAPDRPEKLPQDAEKPFLLPISAKTQTSLHLNIQALANFIAESENPDLEDIAYTLCCGRTHHEKRAAVVVNRSNAVREISTLLAEPEREIHPLKFILVFSHHTVFPASWLTDALQNLPGFSAQWEQLRPQLPGGFADDEKIAAFVFQYCYYQLLQAAGLRFDSLVGDGLGKQVIAVIKGVSSIAEAIATIRLETIPAENLQQRIENLIAREKQDKEPVFLEMGPLGSLSEIIDRVAIVAGCQLIALQNFESAALLNYLQKVYLTGQNLHWPLLFETATARKMPLPPYQFDRQSYWIKPPTEPAIKMPVTFFETRLVPAHTAATAIREGRKLGVMLNASERYKAQVERAFPGDQLYFVSDELPEQAFRERVTELRRNEGIEALLTFILPDETALARLEKPDLEPLLVQWNHWKILAEVDYPVLVFTSRAISATGETPTTFGAGTLALFKGVVTDSGRRDLTLTDFDPEEATAWAVLKNTVFMAHECQIMAIRQGRLFYEECLPNEESANTIAPPFLNGAYLITGGARGIGYEISKSIASGIETGTLILIGKTALEEDSPETGNPTFTARQRRENIAQLRSLNERLEVVYFQLDLADGQAVAATMEKIKSTYGRLELVLHAAGEGSRGILFSAETRESFEPVLAPKIKGALHLYTALQNFDFQKLILFSSLNVLLPQKGSAFYSIANAFLDAFVARDSRIQSIRWPGWHTVGMSAGEPATEFYLSPEEGVAVFKTVMASKRPVVTPVKGDIEAFKRNPFFKIAGRPEVPDASLTSVKDVPDLRQFILDLWKKSLQEPDIQMHDNFFEIGGHSLLGTQIINSLNDVYNIDLFFEDLYDYSTINDLAAYIETLQKEKQPVLIKAEAIAPPVLRIPLSPAQHGVWVAHQLSGAQGNFNIPGLIELQGELDLPALEAALLGVISRHATLRSRFEEENGEVYQSVIPMEQLDFKLETEDFSSLNIPDIQTHARVISGQFATKNIRLDAELPFQMKLLRYAADTHLLAVVLHHIVGDGVSIDIFIRELFENYEEKRHTGIVAAKPLSKNYVDYVLEIRDYLQSEQFTEDKNWWVQQLQAKAPALALPYDYDRPALGTKAAGKIDILFTEAESELFHTVKNDLKVSGYVLFAALVKLLLFKYHGAGWITTGTPYFGRFKKEYEGPIGLFVNLLVNRDDIRADMTFSELVNQIKNGHMEALKHKMFPFEWLTRATGVTGNINRNPFFDVLINYWEDAQGLYGANDYQPVNPQLKRRTFGYAEAFVQEDIVFELLGGKRLYASILYDKDLFQPITIELMKERFLQLLKSLKSGLDKPLSQYDFTLVFENNHTDAAEDLLAEQERF